MSGSRYERELVNRLDTDGWAAMRCPTSGAGTDRDLPDVLAGRPAAEVPTDTGRKWRCVSETLAIELKQRSEKRVYVDAAEVAALERFADAFGATAMIGARFTQRRTATATFLVPVEDARQTEEAYAVDLEDADDRARWVLKD